MRAGQASGLQITELSVPTHADVRGSATLACRYNLQNATLNSVKWYKDEREFFRYTPGMSPPTKAFPAPGIDLDLSLSKSHDTQVTLKPLYYNTSGTFRCEVSADAPKFETVHRESSMTVMALPRENPSIQGVKSSYSIGQEIHANCTADRSRPPATLTWLVNGLEAHRYQVELYSPRDVAAGDGLQSTTLGLSLQLTDRNTMFPTGRLDLLCRASIDSAPSLSRESRKIVMLDQNQKLAQRSAAAGGAASLSVLFTLSLLRRHCS